MKTNQVESKQTDGKQTEGSLPKQGHASSETLAELGCVVATCDCSSRRPTFLRSIVVPVLDQLFNPTPAAPSSNSRNRKDGRVPDSRG